MKYEELKELLIENKNNDYNKKEAHVHHHIELMFLIESLNLW